MLYDRFSREEAAALWEAYRHVDDAMQSQLTSPPCPEPHQDLNWEAGFQGGPTAYSFYQLPTGVVHPCAETATSRAQWRLTRSLACVGSEGGGTAWYLPRLRGGVGRAPRL